MQFSPHTAIQEDERISPLIMEELGRSLRASFEAAAEEPIPRDMALLLLRLALAQALNAFAKEGALEGQEALSIERRSWGWSSP